MSAWRQARAILLLPGVVAVAVPAFILWFSGGANVGWGLEDGLAVALVLLGLGLIAVGAALVVSTIRLFASLGRGTLAPWDPPSNLVVRGPYRYVRHPMISGVCSLLLGEAVLLGSVPLLIWFAAVAAVNAVYLPLVEEPALGRRFGEEFDVYRAHVPRFVPRLRPWGDE